MNPNQKLAYKVVDPRTGREQTVMMEQSVRMFEVSDADTAIECLLDVYGNQPRLCDRVCNLLRAAAIKRAGGVQSKAADILGISRRMMTYHRDQLVIGPGNGGGCE